MKRILIIGSPGTGKSTLSQQLAIILQLPVYHLDDYYWHQNWTRTQSEEWVVQVKKLIAQDQWIIDGNYLSSLPLRLARADTVFFLDYSPYRCLFRAFKRFFTRWRGDRQTLPARIRTDASYQYKITLNWHFIFLILLFPMRQKTKVKQYLHSYMEQGLHIIHCKHPALLKQALFNLSVKNRN